MSKASFQYFGHSTVLLTTESGKRVMLDPWLEGNPKCPANLQDPGQVDFIGLSHGHSDHTGSALELAKKTKAKVFCAYELGMILIKEGLPQDQYLMMNKGGTIPLDGNLHVTLTQAFHSSSYDAKDGNTYYAGEPCGIVVRLESGRSVYFAGDTMLFSDMALIAKRHKPEICFLPIGDRFTMGPEEAAEALSLLKPKLAVPIHFATFGALSGTPEELESRARELAPDVKIVTTQPGEIKEF